MKKITMVVLDPTFLNNVLALIHKAVPGPGFANHLLRGRILVELYAKWREEPVINHLNLEDYLESQYMVPVTTTRETVGEPVEYGWIIPWKGQMVNILEVPEVLLFMLENKEEEELAMCES